MSKLDAISEKLGSLTQRLESREERERAFRIAKKTLEEAGKGAVEGGKFGAYTMYPSVIATGAATGAIAGARRGWEEAHAPEARDDARSFKNWNRRESLDHAVGMYEHLIERGKEPKPHLRAARTVLGGIHGGLAALHGARAPTFARAKEIASSSPRLSLRPPIDRADMEPGLAALRETPFAVYFMPSMQEGTDLNNMDTVKHYQSLGMRGGLEQYMRQALFSGKPKATPWGGVLREDASMATKLDAIVDAVDGLGKRVRRAEVRRADDIPQMSAAVGRFLVSPQARTRARTLGKPKLTARADDPLTAAGIGAAAALASLPGKTHESTSHDVKWASPEPWAHSALATRGWKPDSKMMNLGGGAKVRQTTARDQFPGHVRWRHPEFKGHEIHTFNKEGKGERPEDWTSTYRSHRLAEGKSEDLETHMEHLERMQRIIQVRRAMSPDLRMEHGREIARHLPRKARADLDPITISAGLGFGAGLLAKPARRGLNKGIDLAGKPIEKLMGRGFAERKPATTAIGKLLQAPGKAPAATVRSRTNVARSGLPGRPVRTRPLPPMGTFQRAGLKADRKIAGANRAIAGSRVEHSRAMKSLGASVGATVRTPLSMARGNFNARTANIRPYRNPASRQGQRLRVRAGLAPMERPLLDALADACEDLGKRMDACEARRRADAEPHPDQVLAAHKWTPLNQHGDNDHWWGHPQHGYVMTAPGMEYWAHRAPPSNPKRPDIPGGMLASHRSQPSLDKYLSGLDGKRQDSARADFLFTGNKSKVAGEVKQRQKAEREGAYRGGGGQAAAQKNLIDKAAREMGGSFEWPTRKAPSRTKKLLRSIHGIATRTPKAERVRQGLFPS